MWSWNLVLLSEVQKRNMSTPSQQEKAKAEAKVKKEVEKSGVTDEMKELDAFHKIRMARADFRLFGIRQKNRLAKEAKD